MGVAAAACTDIGAAAGAAAGAAVVVANGAAGCGHGRDSCVRGVAEG